MDMSLFVFTPVRTCKRTLLLYVSKSMWTDLKRESRPTEHAQQSPHLAALLDFPNIIGLNG